MKNQFFYTRTETIPPKTKNPKEEPIIKKYNESFNIDFVIRTVVLQDEKRLVLLNDIHERTTEQPDINPITRKAKGMKKIRQTYQSEIYLSKEDGDRFMKLTEMK